MREQQIKDGLAMLAGGYVVAEERREGLSALRQQAWDDILRVREMKPSGCRCPEALAGVDEDGEPLPHRHNDLDERIATLEGNFMQSHASVGLIEEHRQDLVKMSKKYKTAAIKQGVNLNG